MSIRSSLKKVPFLLAIYRAVPLLSFGARRKHLAQLAQDKLDGELRAKTARRLFQTAFRNELTVRYGPFAGMRYISESSGSQVLPKVLGSYEEPIHPWIAEIIVDKTIHTIIDIGCAEGYYAVGFAWRMPDLQIHAFDIDPIARESTRKLAELNHVSDRISIGVECSFEQLEQFGGPTTLVFCDIEGAEDYLLDPSKAPRLKECSILLEAHDCFVKGVSNRMIKRFTETHRIQIVIDYPGRLGRYDLSSIGDLSEEDRASLLDEVRLAGTPFLFLRPLASLSGWKMPQ